MKKNIYDQIADKARVEGTEFKLMKTNWYSQLNQGKYWVGSPWRAIGGLFH